MGKLRFRLFLLFFNETLSNSYIVTIDIPCTKHTENVTEKLKLYI